MHLGKEQSTGIAEDVEDASVVEPDPSSATPERVAPVTAEGAPAMAEEASTTAAR